MSAGVICDWLVLVGTLATIAVMCLFVFLFLAAVVRGVAGCVVSVRVDPEYKFYPGQDIQIQIAAGKLQVSLPYVYHEAQFLDDVDLEDYYEASSNLLEVATEIKDGQTTVGDVNRLAMLAGSTLAEIDALLRVSDSEHFNKAANDAKNDVQGLLDWLVVEVVSDE